MLSVDTETKSLEYKDGTQTVFMVQWANAEREYYATENTGWDGFLAAIKRESVLVFANASFDVHHLRASGIVNVLDGRWRVHDVQTLARVAIPGRYSYRLEDLGNALLGKDATEQQRALKDAAKQLDLRWTKEDKDYYGLFQKDPRVMAKYGMEDVRLTYNLWGKIWAGASPQDREVYKTEITGVAPILREAEWDGVLVDKPRTKILKARLIKERDEFRQRMLAAGISDAALGELVPDEECPECEPTLGPASAKALREDLLKAGVPLYRMTAKGRDLAVNKDALTEFKEPYPVVADLMAWRNRNLLLKTYVAALERADPRVHTSFSQVIARTSRMSASHPNMQNLPTTEKEREDGTYDIGVRHVLIPGPGQAFAVADYEGIEVRALAYYLGNQELIEELDAGLDLHQRTAWKVAQARGERGAKFEDFVKGGPRGKERDKAKVTTFTSMYGGGARLIGIRLNIPTAEASVVRAETLGAIPGYHELDNRVKRAVRSRAFPHVVTILGRRLYVPRDKPYVALNTIIQGTSAELMKLGLIAATPAIKAHEFKPLLVVHDELLAGGPAENAYGALAAMIGAMEGAYPLSPKLKATGSVSTDSYGRAK